MWLLQSVGRCGLAAPILSERWLNRKGGLPPEGDRRLQDTRQKTKMPLPKEARHSCRAILRNFNREWTRMDAKMKSDWIFVICDWVWGKKPLLPRSWSILLRAVVGASRSKQTEPLMDIPRMARLFLSINSALIWSLIDRVSHRSNWDHTSKARQKPRPRPRRGG